jgi:hypothetical protein
MKLVPRKTISNVGIVGRLRRRLRARRIDDQKNKTNSFPCDGLETPEDAFEKRTYRERRCS